MMIRHKIISAVSCQMDISFLSVKDNQTLDELQMNDIDRLELIMALEDEFECEINDEEAERWVTVQNIINYFQGISK